MTPRGEPAQLSSATTPFLDRGGAKSTSGAGRSMATLSIFVNLKHKPRAPLMGVSKMRHVEGGVRSTTPDGRPTETR